MGNKNSIAVSTKALTRHHDVLLAVLGGVLLAAIFIALGLPFLLTGEVPKEAVKWCLLALMACAAAWFVWRARGSEIRKHGGWQLYPPAGLVVLIAALLLLTACASSPIDPARRTNAQTTTQQQAAQTSGNQAASDAEWNRVLLATSPPWPTYPPPANDPNAAATVNAAVCVHNSSVTKDSTVPGCK
jgi:hypothetical protein